MNPPPRDAPPRILCIGMPVRDLTLRVQSVPAPGSKKNASHFTEICGGNALGGLQETPAFPVHTVDTLGADDIFHGAFALAITEGMETGQAQPFAAAEMYPLRRRLRCSATR